VWGYSWPRHRVNVPCTGLPAYVARRADTTTLCRSQLYPPSQGLWIWLQVFTCLCSSSHADESSINLAKVKRLSHSSNCLFWSH
jgi:hypothetical protein